MASIGLPLASYKLPAPSGSSSRLLNCFIEKAAPDSMKGQVLLRRAPGIDEVLDLTVADADTVRGMGKLGDTLFALVGETLSSIAANGTATTIGTVPGSERVRFAANTDDLVI